MIRRSLLAGCLILLSLSALAQIERQHGAHVHGESEGSFAMDGAEWALTIDLPGFNMLGFEHPPENTQDQEQIDFVTSFLSAGEWLVFAPQAGCHSENISVGLEGYGTMNHDGDAHHDHDHHHDHKHTDSTHAKVTLTASGHCAHPNDLDWVEFALFAEFPNHNHLTMAVLTERAAVQVRLSEAQPRVELNP